MNDTDWTGYCFFMSLATGIISILIALIAATGNVQVFQPITLVLLMGFGILHLLSAGAITKIAHNINSKQIQPSS